MQGIIVVIGLIAVNQTIVLKHSSGVRVLVTVRGAGRSLCEFLISRARWRICQSREEPMTRDTSTSTASFVPQCLRLILSRRALQLALNFEVLSSCTAFVLLGNRCTSSIEYRVKLPSTTLPVIPISNAIVKPSSAPASVPEVLVPMA